MRIPAPPPPPPQHAAYLVEAPQPRASAPPFAALLAAQEPKSRRFPVAMVAGAVVLIGLGAGAYMMFGRGKASAAPEAPAASAPAAPETTPPATAAPAATPAPPPTDTAAAVMGTIRVNGDFPEDAEIYVDAEEVTGRSFRVRPGRHTIEVQTNEFQPWTRTVTIRGNETVRVFVDLELKPDSSQ